MENANWNDLVRKYFPNASDEEVDYILYNETAFPICGLETVVKQLEELKDRRSKGNNNNSLQSASITFTKEEIFEICKMHYDFGGDIEDFYLENWTEHELKTAMMKAIYFI